MNCEFIKKNLVDIVEKAIPLDKTSEVEAHLAACSHCASLVTRFAQEWQAWERLERIEPSPAFWFKLQQKMKETEARKVGVAPLVPGLFGRLQTAVVAAAVVVCVLAGSYAGRYMALGGSVSSELRADSGTDQGFNYYLGGLDDSPRGSVGDLYTNPGNGTGAAAGDEGPAGAGDSAYVTPGNNG